MPKSAAQLLYGPVLVIKQYNKVPIFDKIFFKVLRNNQEPIKERNDSLQLHYFLLLFKVQVNGYNFMRTWTESISFKVLFPFPENKVIWESSEKITFNF